MSSPSRDLRKSPGPVTGNRCSWACALAALALSLACVSSTPARTLRVCADPDNLPFSYRAGEGFENRIAQLMAKDFGAELSYRWQRMGRGFVREILDKAQCDLLIGVPVGFPGVLTTLPYYRSTYVFVTRRDAAWHPSSLDDADLRNCKIAVQALDEEYSPPAAALARRGLESTIVGFYTVGTGVAPMLRAVADRKVHVAIVWGPLASFAAKRFHGVLLLTPVKPEVDFRLPLTFQIAMAVRKADVALRDELQRFLNDHAPEIDQLLSAYGVPRLPLNTSPPTTPETGATVTGTPAD
jgi:mxaJ protein